ncbi:MAG: tRNA (adenosine(37)-N6)-threonylcarbamoyltransferase complex dimerization subunit type 1 TsaB [Actinobacteria bacterium]|nr:tRNA (adenosine(37)-N6)-threonylcarbamoyltransferase complex dimerization subunit type 1 TsaB [Actinomycetota bacterium]
METKADAGYEFEIKRIKFDNSVLNEGTLLIEASSDTLICALKGEENVFFCIETEASKMLQEVLFVVLDEIFNLAGKKSSPRSIPLVVVGNGPGSYTSVRVSVSAARAIAQAAKSKALALDSLEILASSFWLLNSCSFGKIIVARDAKMGQLYYSSFLMEENLEVLEKTRVVGLDDFSKIIERREYNLLVSDSDSVVERFSGVIDSRKVKPNAIGLIDLAEKKIRREKPSEWKDVLPVYLRLSYAEIKRRKDESKD